MLAAFSREIVDCAKCVPNDEFERDRLDGRSIEGGSALARLVRLSVGLLIAGVLSVGGVTAAEFESPSTVLAADVVPRGLLTSATHRVEPQVQVAENLLQLELTSDFGLFDVTSVALLEIRIHEFTVLDQAIAQYEQAHGPLARPRGGGFRIPQGADVNTLSAPRGPTSDLSTTLTDNDTILAARGSRLFRQERRVSTRSVATGPIFESHRRTVAYHLRLDPYSSNPRVRSFLETVADARAKGQFSAGSGLVLRPARPMTRRADGGRIEQEVAQLIRHLELPELRAGLESEIPRMGVSEETVQKFLEHPSYSPTLRASITAHLDLLGEAQGREAFFSSALGARSEAEALSFEQLSRMLAVYHEDVGNIVKLISGGRALPGALRKDGALVLMLPVDYVYWTPTAKRIFDSLREAEGGKGRPIELVVRGTLSRGARTALAARGVTLREAFLAP